MLTDIKENLLSQLQGIESKDKHGRDLDTQHYLQIYRCLELVEELESELAKCNLMQELQPEFVYKETLERPGYV